VQQNKNKLNKQRNKNKLKTNKEASKNNRIKIIYIENTHDKDDDFQDDV